MAAKSEQSIAVLIPCWQEAAVIATMLRHNVYSVDYNRYYFFVGLYPNDQDTLVEVQRVAQEHSRIQYVMGDTPGPTNKAANLNTLYRGMAAWEKEHGITFSIVVFHDSEDVIHPLSFKLYNYLIPRKDMIQIPIFPLDVSLRNMTHWLYADEFAENHTKNIVVREAIRAHVPSAGVGTAFSRSALEQLEKEGMGMPFSVQSVTEDYRTSLALRVHQLKQVFVMQYVTRTRWKKGLFFRTRYVQKSVKEIIAVRALFPLTYAKAVRQKARWIMGIVFQEWQHGLWPKEWRVRYTLAHDRKAFITHFVNGSGYIVFLFWLIYSLVTHENPDYPALQERFNASPWVWYLVLGATVIMGERFLQRTIATARIYGFWAATLVIPRACYGNILNLHALMRAYWIYFRAPKEKPLVWDKTEHVFPGRHILVPYRKRLGDLLLEHSLISEDELQRALLEHSRTGERLGDVLHRLQLITRDTLVHILSLQYQLPLFFQVAGNEDPSLSLLSKKIKRWLQIQGVTPIRLHLADNSVTIGISDPTNEFLLGNIIRYLRSYQVKFVLMG